jgi:hypothetical protein
LCADAFSETAKSFGGTTATFPPPPPLVVLGSMYFGFTGDLGGFFVPENPSPSFGVHRTTRCATTSNFTS